MNWKTLLVITSLTLSAGLTSCGPQAEAPKTGGDSPAPVEAPKTDAPKTDAPKTEAPKGEMAPKGDVKPGDAKAPVDGKAKEAPAKKP